MSLAGKIYVHFFLTLNVNYSFREAIRPNNSVVPCLEQRFKEEIKLTTKIVEAQISR